MPLFNECGLRLKSIQVKMEWESIKRLARQVAIGERLGRIERVLLWVVARVDRIGDDALRKRPCGRGRLRLLLLRGSRGRGCLHAGNVRRQQQHRSRDEM